MIAFASLLIGVGLVTAIGWLIYEVVAAPTPPDPGPRLLTAHEQVQAATAAAVLQPDAPMFAEVDDRQVASAVDALLADLFPTVRPAIPHEES